MTPQADPAGGPRRRLVGTEFIIQSASATIDGITASWGAVADLSATGLDTLKPKPQPQISVSSDGTKATAVWEYYNGTAFVIQSASATIDGSNASWGSGADLSAAGQKAERAQVALSADGTKAVAVWHWQLSVSTKNIVQSATATITGNTVNWSTASDLSDLEQYAYTPQISLSSDGTKAAVAWNANRVVQSATATIIANTATWSAPSVLSSDAEGSADDHQISLSSDGTQAVVIWQRWNNSIYVVESTSATIKENMASWSPVIELSAAGEYNNDPQICLSSDGTKATAVWRRQKDSKYYVQSASTIEDADSCYVIKSNNDKTVVFCL